MPLPAGLTSRALRQDDAPAVTAVMAAEELADVGEVAIELADIVSDWQRPSFDLAASTLGVFDGTRLVGYAEQSGPDRADAAVEPAYHGRGIGTALADWLEQHARDAGSTVIGMPVPQDSPGDRFLAARGYGVRWTSWVLELPAGAAIEPRPLPDGFRLRLAAPDDLRSVWTVVEDAFLEWSVRDREPFADFEAKVVGRPGFEPWNLRVVVDADDAVVGVSSVVLADDCGYVDRLAVRKDLRGRGLAQALLADSFGAARAHGAARSELGTDSRTGALSLYAKVGMTVTSTWVNRAIDL
ncbi:GNAT family N-acetyltransferase [Nocardioides jensenii]|uniref:GNAT family N-acetyltransferase n=1 Tax=Nocardioides jensenii TaxID=1843 RepID=UPI00082C02FB|nr:GNAT family N-acetyltransferase [Nocardioides jensenii]